MELSQEVDRQVSGTDTCGHPWTRPVKAVLADGGFGAIITSIIGRLCAGSRVWGTEGLGAAAFPAPPPLCIADDQLHIDDSLDVGLLVNWQLVHSSLLLCLSPFPSLPTRSLTNIQRY
ncbi:hypothetical protein E2C01_093608 [Portunus trituberculatus]|uniref:Uncharacterized protein n=1 Tax=Portunus trituberculatus TaxID=210409 RepID=A0A5B7JZ64_PORTR|nr:hypothetical protein [Portunus trituberculatus]